MEWRFLVDDFGWIVSVVSLLSVLAAVLIGYGKLKQQIESATQETIKFQRELYQQDGITTYLPRTEYLREKTQLVEKIKGIHLAIKEDCGIRRADCQTMFCGRVDQLQIELQTMSKWMESVQRQQQDNSRGIVSISSQLSLFLRVRGIEVEENITPKTTKITGGRRKND